ncbi:MAG: MBOAT family O-acyltransferase [Bacteroidales bacterium]|jgi:D-alanyl-lipoteichoic acid acyltransferase DltB (MBOAT superfamily)|nr:MBOAT family O-acyltransferase [Bacteroidales bacterium]
MRPGRILLFLLAVVLTLIILNLLTDKQRSERGTLLPQEEHAGIDTSGADGYLRHLADTLTDSDDLPAGPAMHEESYEAAASGPAPVPVATSPSSVPVSSAASGKPAGELLPATAVRLPHPGDLLRDSVARGGQVRIVYYGDSQVEGDRVTSLLRRELRKHGGGTGPGMFAPVMPVMYTRSYVVRSSSNWKRYTLLDYRNGLLPHNRLGPMLALCRFTPPGDSLTTRSFATVKVNPVPGADTAVSRYENLRIFYGNNSDTVLVGIRSGNTLVDFAMLQMGEGPLEYSVPLPAVSEVTVEFTGRNSPDIYALSLESREGVIVDNIPVRGSAGLEFVMTDFRGFEGAFESIRPDLVFLQFGLNVVRNVRSEYHYYEEGLARQVGWLQRATGGVPVVLVSVTDMALRVNDTILRFPNIVAIRDAQKKAAEVSGAVFWDAWESMGGAGSAIKWFNHTPPLASRDLTHLSNAGTDTLATRLYADLLAASTPDTVMHSEPDLVPTPDTLMLTDPDPVHPAADSVSMAEVTGETTEKASGLMGRIFSRFSSLLRYHPDQTFIFTTPGFWIFFLVVMAGFALLHRRRAMCHTWLLFISLYFYYRAGGFFLTLLLLTTVLTYFTAIMTDKAESKAGRRFWLVTNVVVLLGFLSYFKYAAFFTETINSLFNTSFVARDIFSSWSNSLFGTNFNVNTIILPVGISFFTFQALSYSIDVYRRRMAAERNFPDFAFYLTFFPQLVAGPIVRASEFLPQMRGVYDISRNEFGHGIFLILQGLVKKMLISDLISTGFIDRVFDSPAIYSGFENLTAVYGYGLQIYCDFSGYTDIAIGVALLMGFRLPLNFNSPYKAVNISDFWKRWHISLSRWLKDYLYIPLGGNRKGTLRTGFNLMVTMLLGGLWHGAATRFVVWGGLHGTALIAEKIWHHLFRRVTRRRRIARIAGILLTFNFVSFAWIFFRAESMDQAGVMLGQIFSSFRPGDYGRVIMSYLPVIVLIVSGYIIHFLPVTVKESYRGLFIRMPVVVQFLVALAVALLLHRVGSEVVQPFIYFRF